MSFYVQLSVFRNRLQGLHLVDLCNNLLSIFSFYFLHLLSASDSVEVWPSLNHFLGDYVVLTVRHVTSARDCGRRVGRAWCCVTRVLCKCNVPRYNLLSCLKPCLILDWIETFYCRVPLIDTTLVKLITYFRIVHVYCSSCLLGSVDCNFAWRFYSCTQPDTSTW